MKTLQWTLVDTYDSIVSKPFIMSGVAPIIRANSTGASTFNKREMYFTVRYRCVKRSKAVSHMKIEFRIVTIEIIATRLLMCTTDDALVGSAWWSYTGISD